MKFPPFCRTRHYVGHEGITDDGLECSMPRDSSLVSSKWEGLSCWAFWKCRTLSIFGKPTPPSPPRFSPYTYWILYAMASCCHLVARRHIYNTKRGVDHPQWATLQRGIDAIGSNQYRLIIPLSKKWCHSKWREVTRGLAGCYEAWICFWMWGTVKPPEVQQLTISNCDTRITLTILLHACQQPPPLPPCGPAEGSSNP